MDGVVTEGQLCKVYMHASSTGQTLLEPKLKMKS